MKWIQIINSFPIVICFRQAWVSLGDMSKEEAMTEFVRVLDGLCPLFKPYIEAHKTEKEEAERKE